MITPFNFAPHASKLALVGIPQRFIDKFGRMLNRPRTGKPNSHSMPSLMRSIKMPGQDIAPGSNLETVHALTCEVDNRIAAHMDEPDSLGIAWTNSDGSSGQCNYTPDAAVFFPVPEKVDPAWKPGAFREIKPTAYLEAHRKKGHRRYILDETTGRWRCPSAEKVAAEHCGLGYEVITDLDLNLHMPLARNVDFLGDFLRVAPPRVPAALAEGVREYVALHQGCTLEDLLTEFCQLNMDKFCSLVVHREVFVPLSECPLTDARQVRIYSDAVVADAHAVLIRNENNDLRVLRPPLLKLGEVLLLDRVQYEVVDDTKTELVTIRDEALGVKPLRRDHALGLHRAGRLQSQGVPSDKQREISRILTKTPPEALQAAILRLDQLAPYIYTPKRRAAKSEARLSSIQRFWLRKARRAHDLLGHALVGCIDAVHRRGNRKSPLSEERLKALDQGVNDYFLCQDPGTKSDAFAAYKKLCKTLAHQPVSEKTFRERLKRLSRATVVRAQEGEMAGHTHEPPSVGEPSLAARPEFFMHVGRLDEFKFDLAVLDPDLARVLGTMWVAVLIDGYTRSVLSFSVTFEAPSYHATTLVVLHKCIQRWKRLPCVIVTDNGPGFKEDYKEAATNLGFRATWRRSGRGRDGADIERFIGVIQQRVGERLQGRTGLVAKHRRLSKSHLPETRAVYFPLDVVDIFEKVFFETHDELPHDGLNSKTPRGMREASLRDHGERAHANLEFTYELETLLLPKLREDGDAKVQAHDGVQAFKLLYWHEDFAEEQIVGTRVPLRWIPTDITRVRVFVGGRWVDADCLKLRHLRALPPEQLCLITLMIRRDKRLARMKAEERIDTINEMLHDITKSGVELDQVLEMKASAKSLMGDLSFLKFDPTPAPEPSIPLPSTPVAPQSKGMAGIPLGLPASYLDQLQADNRGEAVNE